MSLAASSLSLRPIGMCTSRSNRHITLSSESSPPSVSFRHKTQRRTRVVALALFFCSESGATGGSTGGNGKKRIRKKVDGVLDVEHEIIKFMQQSDKPNAFPSKQELIDAGRSDLVEAALHKGGWVTVGWDAEDKRKQLKLQIDKCRLGDTTVNGRTINGSKKLLLEPSGGNHQPDLQLPLESEISTVVNAVSSSKTDLEGEANEVSAFNDRFDTTELDALLLRARANIDSFKGEIERHTRNKAVKKVASTSSPKQKQQEDASSAKVTFDFTRPKSNATQKKEAVRSVGHEATERWRKRRKEDFNPDNTTVNNALDWIKDMVDKREQLIVQARSRSPKSSEGTASGRLSTRSTISAMKSPSTESEIKETQQQQQQQQQKPGKQPEEDAFSARIRNLENKLVATWAALKSGRSALMKGEDGLLQVQRRSTEEFSKAADSLEFKESEIMQSRSELRKARAQVTALQARFAVELSEARKAAEEKQILLEKAEQSLRMMKPVRIVWPTPAFQVLLTGSFDGWTNKIPMERTGSGSFALNLHLYPGRYEIKFIVDGSWKVDSCRPVTYTDGNENNLLMVS